MEAIELMEQVVQKRESALGLKDSTTIDAINKRALIYSDMGRL